MLEKFLKSNPQLKCVFNFKQFNQVQKDCFPKIMNNQDNIIVSAPTSAGKTVLFELCIAKMMKNNQNKCLYLAPIKSLCHEKANSWKQKFMSKLHVLQLTGDSLQMDPQQLDHSNLIIATPQKIDYLSRQNLNVLKSLSLLLIDQIHMLNMEERGATLEAIVSRIMSINPKIRIIAVSATIPNIQQVGRWLKVPNNMVCVFGQQYRPAKLNKVVLGFKSNGNDFNFEKMLNFKVLEIIRNYSYGGGALIFCQTQKGTEQACQRIISQMKQREFLQNDNQLLSLVQASKNVDNSSLKIMLPQGVAFHNAGLSMKDRSIVQKLFLQFKLKVLCTTSTLAMGINLPARLVIIKSTKCYRGSAKGYQQYTQIQMDQMMGRAGRVPYDTEGTVVIMTQKFNYNKYLNKTNLQNLESQLYNQLIEHLNTQISLKSIQSLGEACNYIENSFFYIRMMNSPKQYGLNSNKDAKQFIKNTSLTLIKKLSAYQIISYSQQTQTLFPKQLSINLSKNAIQINTMIKIIDSMPQILTQRQFLTTICSSNQLSKFRSKLDERKVLKDLNQKNKYTLKEAIANHQRKCFVLVQAELSGNYIQNWEMRRQAGQIIYFLKRLVYCIKNMAYERKLQKNSFWIFCFSQLFLKYLNLKFWDQNNQQILKQFTNVNSKWKAFSARGITNLDQLKANIDKIDSFCQKSSFFSKKISQQLESLTEGVNISVEKLNDNSNGNQNHLGLKIIYRNKIEKIKNILISIQSKDQIYHYKIINETYPQFFVVLRDFNYKKYFVSIIKQGVIGFDEFYWCENGKLIKTNFKKQEKQQHNINKGKRQSLQTNKKNGMNIQTEPIVNRKSKSVQNSGLNLKNYKRQSKKQTSFRQIKYKNKLQNIHQISPLKQQDKQEHSQQNMEHSSTVKRTKQLKITDNYDTIKFKKDPFNTTSFQQSQNPCFQKKIKSTNKLQKFGNLKNYNWRAGFQQIHSDNEEEQFQNTKNRNNNNKKKLLLSQNEFQSSQASQKNGSQSDIKNRLNKFMNKNKSNEQDNFKKNNSSRFDKFPKIIQYNHQINPSRSKYNNFGQLKTHNQIKFIDSRSMNNQRNFNQNNIKNRQSQHSSKLFENPFYQCKSKKSQNITNKQSSSFQDSQYQNVYDYFNNLF